MREILFRGKDENGHWTIGCLSLYSEPGKVEICYPIDYEDDDGNVFPSFDYIEVIPETVGQFTGFTDMNGKKIFEGDIIRSRYSNPYKQDTYEVKFVNDRGGWFPFASGDGCGCCEEDTYAPNDDGSIDYFVVIGNVHDNPELLGGNA